MRPSASFLSFRSRIKALKPGSYTTRFAPSPTGELHLGHAFSALSIEIISRFLGAKTILRIEDHDLVRRREAYIDGIYSDLEWLGLHYDLSSRDPSIAYQSERLSRYQESLNRLRQKGHIYPCICSRKELGQRLPKASSYDGYCLRIAPTEDARPRKWRLKLSPSVYHFDDLWWGPQDQNPARDSGDPILWELANHPSYHFAVVIDDHDQDINLIIRGADLLDSVGRQEALRKTLGYQRKLVYLHHPLLMSNEGGTKLSKSKRSPSLYSLRKEQGLKPEALYAQTLRTLGWEDVPPTISYQDMMGIFQ